MKVGGNFTGFNISAEGLSIQRKKMNLIAENIANADAVRQEDGKPYQRKFLKIVQDQNTSISQKAPGSTLRMATSEYSHFSAPGKQLEIRNINTGMAADELTDSSEGEIVYMPEHPDANPDGYIETSNVNIITEMTDMIAATRSYEANLTALNASKQIAKDSLEI